LYRMDGVKNEISHPKAKVVSFPTMYLFPAYDKQNPVAFERERTAEALLAFVEEHKRSRGHHAAASVEASSTTKTETTVSSAEEESVGSVENEGDRETATEVIDSRTNSEVF
jgi:hypothetical protein